jgi:hypothetical protein
VIRRHLPPSRGGTLTDRGSHVARQTAPPENPALRQAGGRYQDANHASPPLTGARVRDASPSTIISRGAVVQTWSTSSAPPEIPVFLIQAPGPAGSRPRRQPHRFIRPRRLTLGRNASNVPSRSATSCAPRRVVRSICQWKDLAPLTGQGLTQGAALLGRSALLCLPRGHTSGLPRSRPPFWCQVHSVVLLSECPAP